MRGVDVVDSDGGAKVLSLRRADKEFPAAAVWNFPAGKKGTLKLSLQLKPGFEAADISVSDHYSTPYDLEAELYALYRLHIPADARIGKVKLQPGRWYDIAIQWDTAQNEAIVLVDGTRPNGEMKEFLYRDRTNLAVYAKAMYGLACTRSSKRRSWP